MMKYEVLLAMFCSRTVISISFMQRLLFASFERWSKLAKRIAFQGG